MLKAYAGCYDTTTMGYVVPFVTTPVNLGLSDALLAVVLSISLRTFRGGFRRG